MPLPSQYLHPYLSRLRSVLMHVALVGVWACQPELLVPGDPSNGLAYVQASARAHDAAGRWPAFAAAFETAHFWADGNFGFRENLFVDLRLDSFYRSIEEQGYLLEQTVSNGVCAAWWPNPTPAPADLLRVGLTGDACAVIIPRQRYHTFLLGLPMSALLGEASFGESLGQLELWGQSLVVVDVTFPNDPIASSWQLLFDPDTRLLRGAHFSFNQGGGEWIEYRALEAIDNLLIGSVRRIYAEDAETLLVEQRLSFD